MGMCAHIYLISPNAYLAAVRGDIEAFDAGQDGIVEDLDKAWHAIHYLITGNKELGFLLGGIQLEGVSEHFEAHSPESIVTLNQTLTGTTLAALMSNFDSEKFNALDIYPGPWDNSAAGYIENKLVRFASLVQRAADQGKGIAVFVG